MCFGVREVSIFMFLASTGVLVRCVLASVLQALACWEIEKSWLLCDNTSKELQDSTTVAL